MASEPTATFVLLSHVPSVERLRLAYGTVMGIQIEKMLQGGRGKRGRERREE